MFEFEDVLRDFLYTIQPYTTILILMVLPVVLHVYCSLRKNKWAGLLMPAFFFIAVVLTSIRSIFLKGDPLWVLGCFCLLNMPTIAGLIVYDLCRRRVAKKTAEAEAAGKDGDFDMSAETEKMPTEGQEDDANLNKIG